MAEPLAAHTGHYCEDCSQLYVSLPHFSEPKACPPAYCIVESRLGRSAGVFVSAAPSYGRTVALCADGPSMPARLRLPENNLSVISVRQAGIFADNKEKAW